MRTMLLVCLGLLTSWSAHAADVAAGKSAFSLCSTCHAANGGGNQSLNAPRVAGQYDWYLKRQILAFKDGIRGTAPGDIYGAQMRPMAMTLASDAAVDNVVAYIGTLDGAAAGSNGSRRRGDGQNSSTQRAPRATGKKAKAIRSINAPRLVEQDDWYLVRQLQNYKKGVRGANPKDAYGAQMKPMAAMLANDAGDQ